MCITLPRVLHTKYVQLADHYFRQSVYECQAFILGGSIEEFLLSSSQKCIAIICTDYANVNST